jgi:secreted Zn-dependent insulinase-like peptidase
LPRSTGDGAIYLRWTLKSAHPVIWKMLHDSLADLMDNARQAGIGLTFTAYGHHWQLKATGSTAAMPAVIEQALRRLSQPDHTALARYGQRSNEPRLIPIRQLLKALPDHVLMAPATEVDVPLQSLWRTTVWSGLALGFSTQEQNTLLHALSSTPGFPVGESHQPPIIPRPARWQTERSEASEDALLVFCPTPRSCLEDEACWRLFAHILQTPFYQRLRVELQLGYAVFSGFRQIAGQSGLLFGVQSPSTTAAELARHIQQFIAELPSLIAATDIAVQRQTLASQLDLSGMETEQAAESIWQSHLAGHDEDWFDEMKHYLSNLHETVLLAGVDRLTGPGSGWLYLANRSAPGDWLSLHE